MSDAERNKSIKSMSGCDFSLVCANLAHSFPDCVREMERPKRMSGLGGNQLLSTSCSIDLLINDYLLKWSFIVSNSNIFELAQVDMLLGKDALGFGKPLGLHMPCNAAPYLSFNESLPVFVKITGPQAEILREYQELLLR